MKRLAIAAVGLGLVVAFATVALSCSVGSDGGPTSTNGGQQEQPVVPPPGIRATIPAEFPETEEAMLRQLALDSADLPSGFELAFEDAGEEEGGIYYVAHYANERALSEEDLLGPGVPVTIDLFVALFDDEMASTAFFNKLESVSPEELSQYTGTQSHWSAEDLGLEQGEIGATRIPFRDFGDDSLAFSVWETVQFPETDMEMTIVDVSVCIRRGRAVGMVDLGMASQPALRLAAEAIATGEIETLAVKLDERLAIGSR